MRHALFHHKMIYLRDQDITHADHAAFSLRFGPFAEDAYTQGVPGYRDVQPIIKEADDRSAMVFGEGWHTDSPFLREPPSISTLYAIVIPPFGGDTIWANLALAYRMLSDGMRETIARLKVHMSMRDVLKSAQRNAEERDNPIGRLAATRDAEQISDDLAAKVRGNFHPLGAHTPRHGRKGLVLRQLIRDWHRGAAAGGVGADPALSRPAHYTAGVHLQAALGAKDARPLG